MGVTPHALVTAFVILVVVFRLIELTRPRDKRKPFLRRGFFTDLCYWLFTPLVTRAATRAAVLIAVVPVALLLYGRVDQDEMLAGWGPLSRLPLLAQAVLMIILADFVGYWVHRAFHQNWLWRFHAIHHSSVDVDWLSAVRLHPLNDAVMRVAAAVPLLALGFAPLALMTIAPILGVLALVVHANVDWDWGPLRTVIASPRFHRWHHTDESEARDKNFAGLFPLWDILFGTYYMPRDRVPTVFGTTTPVPAGLLGQLWFPFSRRRSDTVAESDAGQTTSGSGDSVPASTGGGAQPAAPAPVHVPTGP
jgi:sterol desaturase/sphingolipid hydroxylase (fatty acid hydroxylase superfamily)